MTEPAATPTTNEAGGLIFRTSVKSPKPIKHIIMPPKEKRSLFRAPSANLSEIIPERSADNETYSKALDFPLSTLGYVRSAEIKKTTQLIHTLCCWLPIPYYELWIIFSVIGYFSLWFVLVILVSIYIFYGIALCRAKFLLIDEEILQNWVSEQDMFYLDDPRYLENNYNIQSYLEEVVVSGKKKLFRKGILVIFFGLVQLMSHAHGFYSFYFRHSLNLFAYTIFLVIFFIINVSSRFTFAMFAKETITIVFRQHFISLLDQRECNVCLPNGALNTFDWPRMSITDFLLKFQVCTLNCCGVLDGDNVNPFARVLKPIPIVCCKSFFPYMFVNDTVYRLPLQMKCIKTIVNNNLPDFPYDTITCPMNERIPSCRKVIKNNIYYAIFERFNKFMTVYKTVLCGYYVLFWLVSVFYLIERFYNRRRILKNIHRKLVSYKL